MTVELPPAQAILRSADGAGACAVVTPNKGAAPISAAVLNVARGASVPVVRGGPYATALRYCHNALLPTDQAWW